MFSLMQKSLYESIFFIKRYFEIHLINNISLKFEFKTSKPYFIKTLPWYINFSLDSDNSLIIKYLSHCLNEDRYHNRVVHFKAIDPQRIKKTYQTKSRQRIYGWMRKRKQGRGFYCHIKNAIVCKGNFFIFST